MILINLLPPELRKRRGGVNPVFVGLGAAAAGLLLLLGLWAYVQFARIPAAEEYFSERQAELADLETKAKEVKDLEAKIADIKKQRDLVVGLVQRKMFWARTIDEFANLLSGSWTLPGFEARCIDLQIVPITQASSKGAVTAGEVISATIRARFKLVGQERDKAGDYVRSFFATVEASPWWRNGGYIGKPEEGKYQGFTPVWKPDLKRVVLELPLEFTRVKTVSVAKAGK